MSCLAFVDLGYLMVIRDHLVIMLLGLMAGEEKDTPTYCPLMIIVIHQLYLEVVVRVVEAR